MGLSTSGLSVVDLGQLLEDHKASFDGYLWPKITAATKQTVSTISGWVDRLEYPVGMFADGSRTAKHAPGADSPVGHNSMGTREYRIDPYSWAEPVNHLAKKDAETRGDALDRIAKGAGHMVIGSIEKELASILGGNGGSGTFDDLTAQAAGGNEWNNATPGDAVEDIESGIDALRGADLICVAGWNVIRALQYNTQFINNADKSRLSWMDVIEELYRLGFSQVFHDVNPVQDGNRTETRSYKGAYDGVFYIGTAQNVICAEMNAFGYDTYESESKRTEFFRASADVDFVSGYAAHGLYYTGILV